MKITINDDRTVTLKAENITEAYALENIYSYHKGDHNKMIVVDGSIIFEADTKHKLKPLKC